MYSPSRKVWDSLHMHIRIISDFAVTQEPVVINTGDAARVKSLLDETAAKVVSDSGYSDDHFYSNLKLAFGGVSCLFALIAHLYPAPFPKNKPALIACCIGYAVCSVILSLLAQFWEKDYILFTKPKGPSSAGLIGLRLRSQLPRFQGIYTLTLEPNAPGPKRSEKYVLQESIGQYFNSDGTFLEDDYVKDVKRIVSDFEQRRKKE